MDARERRRMTLVVLWRRGVRASARVSCVCAARRQLQRRRASACADKSVACEPPLTLTCLAPFLAALLVLYRRCGCVGLATAHAAAQLRASSLRLPRSAARTARPEGVA